MAIPTNRLALLQQNRTCLRRQGKFPAASHDHTWHEAFRQLRMNTMNLLTFDGKRIAIKVPLGSMNHVLRGTGKYARDERLGEIMRVELEDNSESGAPAFLFGKHEWSANVQADLEHGCDYCIDLTAGQNAE